jgi:2-methylcitrate dehydratase
MKLPRRKFLHLAAGAAALPVTPQIAKAQNSQTRPTSAESVPPLAERLATYADRLRYDDLNAATVEQVKALVIDTLGCGIVAFDERPVRICRELALAVGGGASTIIGTNRRTTPDMASFANGAAFRFSDLNDIYVPPQPGRQGAHPSDHIAACIAVAEGTQRNEPIQTDHQPGYRFARDFIAA